MRLRSWLVPAVVAVCAATLVLAPNAEASTSGFTTLLRVDPGRDGFAQFSDISAKSASNIWAAGHVSGATSPSIPSIVHSNGSTWSQVTPPDAPAGGINPSIQQVVPQTGGDAWVLGTADFGPQLDFGFFAAHRSGGIWTTQAFPVGWIMRHLSVVSPTNVWVLGSKSVNGKPEGVFEHWNGSTWTTGSLPAVPTQEGGNRSEAVDWAPAYNATTFAPALLRLRGSSWVVWPMQPITLPAGDTSALISDFVQYSLTDAYMSVGFAAHDGLGAGLQVFHWDGVNWTLILNRSGDAPNGMTADGHGGVWVVSSGLSRLTYLIQVNRTGVVQRVQIPAIQEGGQFQLDSLTGVPGTDILMFSGQIIPSTGSRSYAVIEQYGPLA